MCLICHDHVIKFMQWSQPPISAALWTGGGSDAVAARTHLYQIVALP